MLSSVNPVSGKTANRRAVCGKTARTVRRAERLEPTSLSDPYRSGQCARLGNKAADSSTTRIHICEHKVRCGSAKAARGLSPTGASLRSSAGHTAQRQPASPPQAPRENGRPERSHSLPAPGGDHRVFRLPRHAAQDRKAVCSVWNLRHPPIPAELQATRKPRLLFRFDGSFLLRFADRQFLAVLFQLPPRITRFEPHDRSPQVLVAHHDGIANWTRRRNG